MKYENSSKSAGVSSQTNHGSELLDVDFSFLSLIHRSQHLLHLAISQLDRQILQDEPQLRHFNLPLSLNVKSRYD